MKNLLSVVGVVFALLVFVLCWIKLDKDYKVIGTDELIGMVVGKYEHSGDWTALPTYWIIVEFTESIDAAKYRCAGDFTLEWLRSNSEPKKFYLPLAKELQEKLKVGDRLKFQIDISKRGGRELKGFCIL